MLSRFNSFQSRFFLTPKKSNKSVYNRHNANETVHMPIADKWNPARKLAVQMDGNATYQQDLSVSGCYDERS